MHGEGFSGAVWRKSSRSGNATANCVEVAVTATAVGVRDSKNPGGGMLVLDHDTWRDFISYVKILQTPGASGHN